MEAWLEDLGRRHFTGPPALTNMELPQLRRTEAARAHQAE